MGRVYKKKIAEFNESTENNTKKLATTTNRGKEEKSNKRAESIISVNNDPLTGYNKNDDKTKRVSTDEVESKKTTSASRKRKSNVSAMQLNNANKADESDNAPPNGNKAGIVGVSGKNSRKGTTKGGRTPANCGSKFAKKNVKNNLNDDDDTNDSHNNDSNENEDELEEEEEYEVEKIVSDKIVHGAYYFLVRWKGYTKADDSWEPESTLSCEELIEEYRSKTAASAGNKLKNKSGAGKAGIRKGGGSGNAGVDRKVTSRSTVDKKTDSEPDPEKEWEVEKVVDCVDEGSGRLFRIRWKGFKAKHDTWEPAENLSCDDLIAKFTKRMDEMKNVDTKYLREDPKKTQRLVNETSPRTNLHNRIERSSKRSVTKHRVFYGEE